MTYVRLLRKNIIHNAARAKTPSLPFSLLASSPKSQENTEITHIGQLAEELPDIFEVENI